MKRATLAGAIAPAICVGLCLGPSFGLAAQALAADAGAADNPAMTREQCLRRKAGAGRGRAGVAAAADCFGAAAHRARMPRCGTKSCLGTEVRNPQDELLGSVTDLVRSPQTDKIIVPGDQPGQEYRDRRQDTSRCPWKPSR